MIELRRCLSEKQNILARLFHIELKDQIKAALAIMDKLPIPSIGSGELESYNSRILIDIRDDMLCSIPGDDKPNHTGNGRNKKIVESAFNFLILLNDSDEAWEQVLYQALLRIKETDWKPPRSGEPRSEYWRE